VACVVRICPDQQAAKKANYPGACAPRTQRLHETVQSSPCSTQDMVRFVFHTVCLSVYSLPAFAGLQAQPIVLLTSLWPSTRTDVVSRIRKVDRKGANELNLHAGKKNPDASHSRIARLSTTRIWSAPTTVLRHCAVTEIVRLLLHLLKGS
jgi:hypothetical protein